MLVSNTQVNTSKKLEETIHVHVRLLSQDSTFDLFNFFPNFFFQNLSCQTCLSASAAYMPVFMVINKLFIMVISNVNFQLNLRAKNSSI